MTRRTATTRTVGPLQIVTLDCGCDYGRDGGIIVPCEGHRYITCGRCRGRAEVSPIGVLCPRCTFGGQR